MSLNSMDTHAQLASIMERFAKSALAEMTKIIDGDSAVLRSEISRRQMEIESLWCKLQFAENELKIARQTAKRSPNLRSVGVQVSDDAPVQEVSSPDFVRGRTVCDKEGTSTQKEAFSVHSFSVKTVHITEEDAESLQIKEERPEGAPWSSQEGAGEALASWEDGRDTANVPDEGSDFNLPHDTKPSAVWESVVAEDIGSDPAHGAELLSEPLHARRAQPSTSLPSHITGKDLATQLHPETDSNLNGQHRQASVRNVAAIHSVSPVPEQRLRSFRPSEKSSRCHLCGKTFTTRFYLKIHQRIHSGERPYTCPQCGKRFYCNSHLISHQRSHTGEKPYSCEECGKSYSHLNSLKLHQRSHTEEGAFGYW